MPLPVLRIRNGYPRSIVKKAPDPDPQQISEVLRNQKIYTKLSEIWSGMLISDPGSRFFSKSKGSGSATFCVSELSVVFEIFRPIGSFVTKILLMPWPIDFYLFCFTFRHTARARHWRNRSERCLLLPGMYERIHNTDQLLFSKWTRIARLKNMELKKININFCIS